LQIPLTAFKEAATLAAAVAVTQNYCSIYSYSRNQCRDNRRDKSKSQGRTSSYSQRKGVTARVSAREILQ
jgi:hypothetical protein